MWRKKICNSIKNIFNHTLKSESHDQLVSSPSQDFYLVDFWGIFSQKMLLCLPNVPTFTVPFSWAIIQLCHYNGSILLCVGVFFWIKLAKWEHGKESLPRRDERVPLFGCCKLNFTRRGAPTSPYLLFTWYQIGPFYMMHLQNRQNNSSSPPSAGLIQSARVYSSIPSWNLTYVWPSLL